MFIKYSYHAYAIDINKIYNPIIIRVITYATIFQPYKTKCIINDKFKFKYFPELKYYNKLFYND